MILGWLTPRLRQGLCALVLLLGCSAPSLALPSQLPHLSDEAEQKAVMRDPQKTRERLLAYVKPGAPATPRDQMIAFTNIAISHMAQRNRNKILEAAQSGFLIAQRLGDKHFMAQNLSYMGISNNAQDKLSEAIIQFKQASEFSADIKDLDQWGMALFLLSSTLDAYGDYENSLKYSLESEKVVTVYGGMKFDRAGYTVRAHTYLSLNRIDDAKRVLELAIRNSSPDDIPFKIERTVLEAKIYEKMNLTDKAEQSALACLGLMKQAQFPDDASIGCRSVLARVAIRRNDLQAAKVQIDTIFRLLENSGQGKGIANLIPLEGAHELALMLAKAAHNAEDISKETAIIREMEARISATIQQSRAALLAAEIKDTGKDISLSLLEAQNRNLDLEKRENLILAIGGLLSIGTAALAFFIWYRAKQLRLRQEQQHGERTRIARDLHDTPLQNAASAQMQLQAAVMQARRENAPVAERLGSIVAQMGTMMTAARDVVWHLRSPAVEQGNLPAAINEWLAHARAEATSTIVSDTSGEGIRLTPDQTEEALRITQEAVGNAIRHAGAKTITIGLAKDETQIKLTVADDGQGFEANRPEQFAEAGRHFGLVGMIERAHNLGGTLAIESAPGAGTKVSLLVPTV